MRFLIKSRTKKEKEGTRFTNGRSQSILSVANRTRKMFSISSNILSGFCTPQYCDFCAVDYKLDTRRTSYSESKDCNGNFSTPSSAGVHSQGKSREGVLSAYYRRTLRMFSRGVNGEMKRTAVSHQPLHLPLVVARTALQLAPSVEPQEIQQPSQCEPKFQGSTWSE